MKLRTARKVIKRLCCEAKRYRWSTIDAALQRGCKIAPRWKQPLGKHNCWCSEMKELWRRTTREMWKWEW